MADSKEQDKEQKKEQNKQIESICSLSIPTIITALHQNAIAHCNAASKGMHVVNSAIEDKGKDSKLKSAGEHVISVVPLKNGERIQKIDAIDVIKNYVQWFVGPDLANKINDSSVKSLLETPEAGEQQKQDEAKNESFKMSFSQYLLLESSDDSDDETGEGDDSDDETGEGDDSDDETGEGDDNEDTSGEGDDDNKPDEKVESEIGYYVAYNLKIDGMKSTALKDAMKKFAATLFDDLTIKADGLFGGGQSFTVGDVKKAIKGLFGGVNASQLQTTLRNNLSKKYDNVQVSVLSKEKILRSYKKDLDVKQKAEIDKADNSVIVTIPPPDSAEVNPQIIADMITSSIKGIFKQFKHQVKKDDIILISKEKPKSNSEDSSDSADAKAEISIPNPARFESQLTSGISFKDSYDSITRLMDKVKNHDGFSDKPFAKKAYDLWVNWKDNHSTDAQNDEKLGDDSVQKLKTHFKQFLTDYQKIYDEEKESRKTKLNEMDDIIHSIICESIRRRFYGNTDRIRDSINLKNEIIDILLGDNCALAEDEESELNAEDGDVDISGEDEDNSDDNSTKDKSNKQTTDTYIIPMPGLKSESDDE